MFKSPVNNVQMLFVGVFASLLMAFLSHLLIWAIIIWLIPDMPELIEPLSYIFGVAVGLWFFLAGQTDVPTGYWGVYKFFESRLEAWQKEGWGWWLPWPFGSITAVDVRPGGLNPDNANELAFPVNVISSDEIKYVAKIAALLKIVNPFKYLGFADVERFIREKLEQATRISGSTFESDKITKHTVDVTHDIKGGGDDPDDDRNPETRKRARQIGRDLQEFCAKAGISLEELSCDEIMPPPEILAASAQKRVETEQRISEATQLKALLERIATADAQFGGRLSLEKILDADQAERGKVRKIVIDGGTPIERAASMIGDKGLLGGSDGAGS